MALNLNKDGAALHSAALSDSELETFRSLADQAKAGAGLRLHGNTLVQMLTGQGSSAHRIAKDVLGEGTQAVRAVLFDKTPTTNWSLGWHQDRTIVVKERNETHGFGPWSTKAELQHVEPPFELFSKMVTLRIHLDPVDENNAPLLIALGSHQQGRVPIKDIDTVVSRSKIHTCLAGPGTIWSYRTPILHASSGSTGHTHRRVLQVDYCAVSLPNPLEWLGV